MLNGRIGVAAAVERPGRSGPIAETRRPVDYRNMSSLSTLSQPHVRDELQVHLSELHADDPRIVWENQRRNGLASGINEVFHFFFDDHDFDSQSVGCSILNAEELQTIEAVKLALAAILVEVGDAGDDDFVCHPLWAAVRGAAADASARLQEGA